MKKTLLVITTLLFISSCSQKTTTDTTNKSSYNSKEFNISFEYPSDWDLKEDKTKNTVTIQSPPTNDAGTNITVTIPAESFDVYENANKDLIPEYMTVIDKSPLDNKKYIAKEYSQHGWLYYLIEIDGHYVGVGGERYLNQEQKDGLEEILSSLSF